MAEERKRFIDLTVLNEGRRANWYRSKGVRGETNEPAGDDGSQRSRIGAPGGLRESKNNIILLKLNPFHDA